MEHPPVTVIATGKVDVAATGNVPLYTLLAGAAVVIVIAAGVAFVAVVVFCTSGATLKFAVPA